jgi:hypothetical protein
MPEVEQSIRMKGGMKGGGKGELVDSTKYVGEPYLNSRLARAQGGVLTHQSGTEVEAELAAGFCRFAVTSRSWCAELNAASSDWTG